jgi:hypothetical protein
MTPFCDTVPWKHPFAVSYTTQFMAHLRPIHWSTIKDILLYIISSFWFFAFPSSFQGFESTQPFLLSIPPYVLHLCHSSIHDIKILQHGCNTNLKS